MIRRVKPTEIFSWGLFVLIIKHTRLDFMEKQQFWELLIVQFDCIILQFVCLLVCLIDYNSCPRGWMNMTGECFKLNCGADYSWREGRVQCLKSQADLASLDENSLLLVSQYFERMQVRLAGFTAVSVGLSRTGRKWSWLDGRLYAGNLSLTQSRNAHLAWNKRDRRWDVDVMFNYNDLFLCKKSQGKYQM